LLDELFADDALPSQPDEAEARKKKKKKKRKRKAEEEEEEAAEGEQVAGQGQSKVIVVDGTGASQYDFTVATAASRKRFMSYKIGKAKDWTVEEEQDEEEDGPSNKELFMDFRAEVEALGAEALTGADRKEYQMKKLKLLGATMPKSQKVPISILRGMKAHLEKKNARWAQRAFCGLLTHSMLLCTLRSAGWTKRPRVCRCSTVLGPRRQAR